MELWNIDTQLPYKAQAQFVKDPLGKSYWVLNMRVDFDLDDSGLCESDEQSEPALKTVYDAEPGESSVMFDTDFVIFKPNTDIVITGMVRSKSNKLERELMAQLMIEPHINKRLKFYGPREWVTHAKQMTIGQAKQITESKISYQHTVGGEANKIGCGVGDSVSELLKTGVPSQFYADQEWRYKHPSLAPASFEPMAPFMSLRAQYAGTYDQNWFDEQYPLKPLDFDHRFNQQSPPDQQWDGWLQGGERVVLSGFFSNGEREFVIPKQCFSAMIQLKDRKVTVPLKLYTVNIDTKESRVSAIWHFAYECHNQTTDIVSVEIVDTAA